ARRVDSLAIPEALASLRILSSQAGQECFGYQGDGLNVAFVRVFEIWPVGNVQSGKRFSGCRSWIDLPPPPEMEMRSVLDDAVHEKLRAEFDRIVGVEG